MFETAEEKWLKIYKGYTVGMFWVYLLAGIVLCIMGWSDWFWWIDPFVDGLIFLAAGFFVAFAHLGINMFVIKMMDDIATIRKCEMSLVRQAKEQKKD